MVSLPDHLFFDLLPSSLQNSIVIDPSAFYSNRHLDLVLGTTRAFRTREIALPQKLHHMLLKPEMKNEFINFMVEYWNGDPTQVSEAWESARGLIKTESFRPNSLRESFDKRYDRRLFDVLKSQFPGEGDVLFDLITMPMERNAFLVGFGHSKWKFIEKVEMLKKSQARLKRIGARFEIKIRLLPDKTKKLHRWKNAHLQPKVAKRGVAFGALGGYLAKIDPLYGLAYAGVMLFLID